MFPILDWQLASLPGFVDPTGTRSAEFNAEVGINATMTKETEMNMTDLTSRGLLGRGVIKDSVDVLH